MPVCSLSHSTSSRGTAQATSSVCWTTTVMSSAASAALVRLSAASTTAGTSESVITAAASIRAATHNRPRPKAMRTPGCSRSLPRRPRQRPVCAESTRSPLASPLPGRQSVRLAVRSPWEGARGQSGPAGSISSSTWALFFAEVVGPDESTPPTVSGWTKQRLAIRHILVKAHALDVLGHSSRKTRARAQDQAARELSLYRPRIKRQCHRPLSISPLSFAQ